MNPKEKHDFFANGEAYEHYVGRWSRPVGHLFLDWLSLPSGLQWADVGCGTGALTETILKNAEPRSIVGVEPSEGFLQVARAGIEDARVKFRHGDAQSLPIEKAQVDVAVAGLVLNFVPDKKRALEEMRRIVRPGGTIAAYVWDYAGEMQLMRYFWDAVAELFPDGAEKDEGRQFPICKPEPLADLFRDAGLKSFKTVGLDAPTPFADFDDYWSPFLRGQGPAGAYCAQLSEEDREALRKRLVKMVPIHSDGTIHLIARAWAVRGTV